MELEVSMHNVNRDVCLYGQTVPKNVMQEMADEERVLSENAKMASKVDPK